MPLGREMCFTLCMLWVESLCNSFRDSSGSSCGNSVVACFLHSYSSSVVWS